MAVESENDPEFRPVAPKRSRSPRHFTLIELLVVVAVIGLLIALLLPFHRSARPAARRAHCVNNLKQIGLALHRYEEIHGMLPPAHTTDAAGHPLHSWRTLILPYLDYQSVYEQIDLAKPWNDPANAVARETGIAVFRCPENRGPQNTTTYLAIVGPNRCFLPTDPRRLSEITDHPHDTLMVIEAGLDRAVPWMAPVDADDALVLSIGPKSRLPHAGGVNGGFVDGSVRFLKANFSEGLRRDVLSISGGEPRGVDFDW